MNFLSMMIAVSLHQLLQAAPERPGDALLLRWRRWVGQQVSAPGLQVVLTLLVPGLLAYWCLDAVGGWLFGLVSLLATAALLLWSLGREDYHTLMERYLAQREAGNEEAAWLGVQDIWVPAAGDSGSEQEQETESRGAAAQCEQRLLYCGYQRWFAPLLYFLLLGPVAAALYRGLQILARRDEDPRYREVLSWADWLPTRVLALSFAITGDFSAVLQSRPLGGDATESQRLLASARAAAGLLYAPRALSDLLYRTAGLWLLLASLWFIIM